MSETEPPSSPRKDQKKKERPTNLSKATSQWSVGTKTTASTLNRSNREITIGLEGNFPYFETVLEQLKEFARIDNERYELVSKRYDLVIDVYNRVHNQLKGLSDTTPVYEEPVVYTPRSKARAVPAECLKHTELFHEPERDPFLTLHDSTQRSLKISHETSQSTAKIGQITALRHKVKRNQLSLSSSNSGGINIDDITDGKNAAQKFDDLRLQKQSQQNIEKEIVSIANRFGPGCVRFIDILQKKFTREVDENLANCIHHLAPYAMFDYSIAAQEIFASLKSSSNRQFYEIGRDTLRTYVTIKEMRRCTPPQDVPAIFSAVLSGLAKWLIDFFGDEDSEWLVPQFWTLIDSSKNLHYDDESLAAVRYKLKGDVPLVLIGMSCFMEAPRMTKILLESICKQIEKK